MPRPTHGLVPRRISRRMPRRVPRLAGAVGTAQLLLGAATLSAQQGAIPDGWTARPDRPSVAITGDSLTDGQFRYERMPPGWHMTTTTSGVSVFPRGHSVSGAWGVEVEFFLFPDPSEQPVGVVIDAADRPAGSMRLEFLMRADGAASLVSVRDEAREVLVPWTTNSAVAPHDGTSVTPYVLRVVHQDGRIVFAINGTQMLATETGGEDHRSIPGFRLGAGLNVHVARFDLIKPLAPPPAPQ